MLLFKQQATNNQTENTMIDDFEGKFNSFVVGCEKISNDYMDKQFPTLPKPKFTVNDGKRFMKVVRDSSVHCFVDKTNGDVLKAAGWNAPAKHARGNIFDESNGLSKMGEYGPAYLK